MFLGTQSCWCREDTVCTKTKKTGTAAFAYLNHLTSEQDNLLNAVSRKMSLSAACVELVDIHPPLPSQVRFSSSWSHGMMSWFHKVKAEEISSCAHFYVDQNPWLIQNSSMVKGWSSRNITVITPASSEPRWCCSSARTCNSKFQNRKDIYCCSSACKCSFQKE